jgi:peptidoglycan/xylan/chitin deacetylase (PgdA/CDA1 family)
MNLHNVRAMKRAVLTMLVSSLLVSCAQIPLQPTTPPVTQVNNITTPKPVARKPTEGQIVGRNDRFIVYVPKPNESFRSIARDLLSDQDLYWMIADFNDVQAPQAGQPLVVPLKPSNPTGVLPNGYQTVPVLCYHRFGNEGGKMVVSPKVFGEQMAYLAQNGYRVVRLSELAEFLAGKRALPEKAVVVTIDDGYTSMYNHAYPILKRYGFPATVFVYTDFIGARDALTWDQMQELVATGLIDVQAHSKTHSNLTIRGYSESDAAYRDRLNSEVAMPRQVLERKLRVNVSTYAYPYGDTNPTLIETLQKASYRLALTVDPGGNAFFTPPYQLRRTMVMGDQSLDTFKAQLQVFKPANLR